MAQSQGGFSNTEILSMQKDAIRRVNEMQRIAREKIEQTQGVHPQQMNRPKENNEPIKPIHSPPQPIERCETEIIRGNSFTGILDKLNLDEEKILLIMLGIILMNEGADIMLILALGYILL